MASREVCVNLALTIMVLLIAAGTARAQGAGSGQTASGAPSESSAVAQEPLEQNAEPEWRWRFITIGGDVSATSAYVWRGWVLDDGNCLQPDLWVTVGDFTVTSWINVPGRPGGDARLNEYDLTVDYSREVKSVKLSAGWTNYRFFGHEAGHTNEFYVGVRADVFLQPGVQV